MSTKSPLVFYYQALRDIEKDEELFDIYSDDGQRAGMQDIDQFTQDTDVEEDDDEVNDPTVSTQDFN
jgi:hypothetical protein